MGEELVVSELCVGYFKSQASFPFNGRFSYNGLCEMVEGKDDQCIDTLFLYITGYVDRVT